jgi:hypothetical protein
MRWLGITRLPHHNTLYNMLVSAVKLWLRTWLRLYTISMSVQFAPLRPLRSLPTLQHVLPRSMGIPAEPPNAAPVLGHCRFAQAAGSLLTPTRQATQPPLNGNHVALALHRIGGVGGRWAPGNTPRYLTGALSLSSDPRALHPEERRCAPRRAWSPGQWCSSRSG